MQSKMMQRWQPDAIRFMRDASAFGDYHRKLAEVLRPLLPADGHVCDAGCGLGALALELAQCCREVTAVDVSQDALAVLQEMSGQCRNLHIRCGDIMSMEARYDAMIFCYFGRTDEILRIAARQCTDTVVIAKRDCSAHRFSLGEVKRTHHTAETTTERLKQLGIPYTAQRLSLELGQPFRSAEDAVTFFRLYDKSGAAVRKEEVMERLRPIDHSEFSLYLPSVRQMELIRFSARDIPKGARE